MVSAVALAHCLAGTPASAGEIWTCIFSGPMGTHPVATYAIDGNNLVETWQTGGISTKLVLLENNRFGLVAVRSIAAIENGHEYPTVGFGAVAIDTSTRQAWHSDATSGGAQSGEYLNGLSQGTCIKD